jgi:hypothetical protein
LAISLWLKRPWYRLLGKREEGPTTGGSDLKLSQANGQRLKAKSFFIPPKPLIFDALYSAQ